MVQDERSNETWSFPVLVLVTWVGFDVEEGVTGSGGLRPTEPREDEGTLFVFTGVSSG